MRRFLFSLLCLSLSVTASGADSVRSLVTGAALPDLRWPDISDYRRHLDAFYAARNDALAWSRDGKPTPQALKLARVFAAADGKGINAIDYDGDRWPARLTALQTDASPESLARFDVGMTATLMRYISDLHIGRVNPTRVEFFLDINHKYDLPKLVASLVNVDDIAGELEKVEPKYDGYRRLRDALARYRAIVAEGDAAPLPEVKKVIEPGSSWEAVPQLAARLRRVGDLDVAVTGTKYEGAIVAAVKRFQERHGLDADGRIGRTTIAALNVPLTRRVEQIRLSMERWRWIPWELDGPPIVVNIPEFRLRAFDDSNRVELEMNVVVGSAFQGRQTPVFAETMKYLVFRPYWNVPPSIQRKELMPKVAKDPSYLKKNNYEMVDGRIRQKPGPGNALGGVKFMFPNSMNIYLHDTSSRQLFSKARRDFSHGCIRVGNPPALAGWVLRDDPKWTPEVINKAMTTGPDDAHVNVKRPIPVLIVYATAVARPDGSVAFFEDIYGHDTILDDALGAGYPYPW